MARIGPSYNPQAAANRYGYLSDWGDYLSRWRDRNQADELRAWKNQLAMEASERAKEAHKQSMINAELLEDSRRQAISDARRQRELLEEQESRYINDPKERARLERISFGEPPPRPTFRGKAGVANLANYESGYTGDIFDRVNEDERNLVDPLLAAAAGGPGWGSAMAPSSLPPTVEEQRIAKQELAEGTRREIALNLALFENRLIALNKEARDAEAHGNDQILDQLNIEIKRINKQVEELKLKKARIEAETDREQRSIAEELRLQALGGVVRIEDEVFGNLNLGLERLKGLDITSDKYRTALRRLASIPPALGGINSGTYNAYLAESNEAIEKKNKLKAGPTPEEKLLAEKKYHEDIAGGFHVLQRQAMATEEEGGFRRLTPQQLEEAHKQEENKSREWLTRQGFADKYGDRQLAQLGFADAVAGKVYKAPDTEYGISKSLNRKDIGKTLDKVIKEVIGSGKGTEYGWSGQGDMVEASLDKEERNDIISTLFEYARQLKETGKENDTLPNIVKKIINKIGLPAAPGDRVEWGLGGFSNYQDYIPMTMNEIKSAYEGDNEAAVDIPGENAASMPRLSTKDIDIGAKKLQNPVISPRRVYGGL